MTYPDSEPDILTGRQCAAARALLGWRLKDLAEAADVSDRSINLFENGRIEGKYLSPKIEKALRHAGVRWRSHNGRDWISYLPSRDAN